MLSFITSYSFTYPTHLNYSFHGNHKNLKDFGDYLFQIKKFNGRTGYGFVISLENFYGYKFDDGIGYVDYALIGSQGEVYYNGNVEIPSSIIQQWGASDNIIWDYIANTLSLTIINNQ